MRRPTAAEEDQFSQAAVASAAEETAGGKRRRQKSKGTATRASPVERAKAPLIKRPATNLPTEGSCERDAPFGALLAEAATRGAWNPWGLQAPRCGAEVGIAPEVRIPLACQGSVGSSQASTLPWGEAVDGEEDSEAVIDAVMKELGLEDVPDKADADERLPPRRTNAEEDLDAGARGCGEPAAEPPAATAAEPRSARRSRWRAMPGIPSQFPGTEPAAMEEGAAPPPWLAAAPADADDLPAGGGAVPAPTTEAAAAATPPTEPLPNTQAIRSGVDGPFVCSRCKQVVDPLRVYGKGQEAWRCVTCHSKASTLSKTMPVWPPADWHLVPEDEKTKFWLATHRISSGKVMATMVTRLVTRSKTLYSDDAMQGEWQPIGVWVSRGYDREAIESTADDGNSKPHRRWGTVYKVDWRGFAHGERKEDKDEAVEETRAKRKRKRPPAATEAPPSPRPTPRAPPDQDTPSSKSSSTTTTTSSSSSPATGKKDKKDKGKQAKARKEKEKRKKAAKAAKAEAKKKKREAKAERKRKEKEREAAKLKAAEDKAKAKQKRETEALATKAIAKLGQTKQALQTAMFHPEKNSAAEWAVTACTQSLAKVDAMLKEAHAVNKGAQSTLPWSKDELQSAAIKADSDAILLSGQCDAAQKAKNKRER